MTAFNRRDWLRTTAVGLLTAPVAAAAPAPRVRFGFSLYGMKSLPVADALTACAKIGYDAVELALMPGYPTDPAKLSAADRIDIRKRIADAGLAVPVLMENLAEPADDARHAANLDRLKLAFDFAHQLSPDTPPLLESVLGGKPAEWEQVKNKLADRLGRWAEAARKVKVIIAVKPHVGNAMHTPAAAAWLMKQVGSPWLKLAFDQSHFALRDIAVAEALKPMLADTVFVHVKDAKGSAQKFEFLLPGDGTTIDYPAYFGLLKRGGYSGPIVVEVSGMLSNKPGYDPIAAAKRSYANLAPALAESGLWKKT